MWNFKRVLIFIVAVLLATVLASATAAQVQYSKENDENEAALPSALSGFLEATIAQARGELTRAEELFQEALEADPENSEVRIRFAAMLLDTGRAERAWKLLREYDGSDWFGLRTRALALAQIAPEKPELLGEAEKALRKAIDERGDEPNLQLGLVQVLRRLGRLHEAEEIIAGLRGVRPDNPRLIMYHGSLLRSLGRLEEAAQLFRDCADRKVLPSVCNESLVEVLIQMGRYQEAGQVLLEGGASTGPEELLRAGSLLLEGGNPILALEAIQRVLDENPDHTAARRLAAMAFSAAGRHDKAVDALKKLLREDKDNVDVLLPLAWAEARVNRLESARERLEQAWRLVSVRGRSERITSVAIAGARVELVAGNNLLAREWLERVEEPAVDSDELVRLLALTYRRAEQWREGIAAMLRIAPRVRGMARSHAVAFEGEFRLQSGDEKGLSTLEPLLKSADIAEVNLGLQVLQLIERWSEVERVARLSLERFPNDRGLRFGRAAALERMQRFEDAEAEFRILVEEEPDDAIVSNYLGYMWADQGRHLNDALKLIRKAVSLQPDSAAYADSLGWVHYRLGNMEEAERWLRRSIALGGEDGTILSHLGEVLVKGLGRIDEGRQVLQRALDLGCDNPEHVTGLLQVEHDGE
jgi:tetratricopeptide (TPR) repeat protein